MGILDKLLGRKPETDEPVELAECPHVVLVPKWDDAADIGKEELASRFECGACGASFTPDEAKVLRETEAERIRSGA